MAKLSVVITTKQDAIDQMVAVSIAEDMEPGGERAEPDYIKTLVIMFLGTLQVVALEEEL
jgi:hypothetical protein